MLARLPVLLVVPVVVAAALPGTATAPTDQGGSIPVWFPWTQPVLDVVVVPPHHGPVCLSLCAGASPMSVLDVDHYRSALEAVFADWLEARDRWVAAHPEDAWLLGFGLRVVWLDGSPTAADLAGAEIVVGHWETAGVLLGVAVHPLHANALKDLREDLGDRCLVFNGVSYAGANLTWADYYNVGVQEFGHCLGLSHSDVNHDAMDGTYDHLIGSTSALHCPSNLDLAGLRLSLGPAFGQPPGPAVATVDLWEPYPVRPGCEGV